MCKCLCMCVCVCVSVCHAFVCMCVHNRKWLKNYVLKKLLGDDYEKIRHRRVRKYYSRCTPTRPRPSSIHPVPLVLPALFRREFRADIRAYCIFVLYTRLRLFIDRRKKCTNNKINRCRRRLRRYRNSFRGETTGKKSIICSAYKIIARESHNWRVAFLFTTFYTHTHAPTRTRTRAHSSNEANKEVKGWEKCWKLLEKKWPKSDPFFTTLYTQRGFFIIVIF